MTTFYKCAALIGLLSVGLALTGHARDKQKDKQDNLIRDPNFETVGEVGDTAAWVFGSFDTRASVVKGKEENSLQIENSADSGVEAPMVKQDLSLEQGRSYDVKFSAKGEGNSEFRAYVEWVDDEGFHNAIVGYTPSDGKWEEYSLDFKFAFVGKLKATYFVFQMKGTGKVLFSSPSLIPQP